ncbi:MAG: type ISP restriction/modification enzyme [Nitrosomonas sp.]|nr:type ISP restriction/modification enzyme [Nitrosomonas sp.]MDP2225041.1 type ISP restriction/modification enzyme [Nitrosomonas sp.]
MALGDKTGKGVTTLFSNFSRGLETGRDAWCYNSSQKAVMDNMVSMITFYNSEVQRFNAARTGLDKKAREEAVDSFINTNPAQISWTSSLKQELNEAAIAEKHPSATSFNNIIHPHPERDFFVLYHEDESS